MKKIIYFFSLMLISLTVLVGCKENSAEITNSDLQVSKPLLASDTVTSQNTPIVNREESEFDVNDVAMIETPSSTCFSEIGYDSSYEILVVTFRDSNQTYLYESFSEEDWEHFKSADSLGGYFNSNIKGVYSCYKWGEK